MAHPSSDPHRERTLVTTAARKMGLFNCPRLVLAPTRLLLLLLLSLARTPPPGVSAAVVVQDLYSTQESHLARTMEQVVGWGGGGGVRGGDLVSAA